MKSKRRKSETTSDSGSEENGVARPSTDANLMPKEEKESDENAEPVESPVALRKSVTKKRSFRARHGPKIQSEESSGERGSEEDAQPDADEEENGNLGKGGASKRRKKEEQKASTSIRKDPDDEKEYEVEKIVGQRTIKGRRQFLVRWKGYGEDSDTWEQEKDLNCTKLIEQFLEEDGESEQNAEQHMLEKSVKNSPKTKSPKIEKKTRKSKVSIKKDTENDKQPIVEEGIKKDNDKEFEVEKIIEVHFKKNKTREFLIRWKGFTSADDTWEPEENLNCPDLIAKFMQKVEKAKNSEMRELRTNRPHTKRYTLATPEQGRRLSRRNMDKQRATYHECDE